MKILAFFTEDKIPKEGLTPTILIYDIETKTKITDIMEEIGDGFYVYDFTGAQDLKEYAIRCDGGDSLPTEERYLWGGQELLIEKEDGKLC